MNLVGYQPSTVTGASPIENAANADYCKIDMPDLDSPLMDYNGWVSEDLYSQTICLVVMERVVYS